MGECEEKGDYERQAVQEKREKKREARTATLSVPVSLVRSVDLPTEGKPIKDTRAWPVFATSNPGPPAPPEEGPSSSCVLSLASLAFKRPMWYSLQHPGCAKRRK